MKDDHMGNQPANVGVRVAGIILAAGGASRMQRPKLLLPWQGEALICRAARTALAGCLDPVVVVTGAGAAEMRVALTNLAVQVVHNPDWASGQSTSVRAGILALTDLVDAAIFLLGDQPYVSPELLRALVDTYVQTRPVILAPFVGDRRSNPVLFDRTLFAKLCQLPGDVGARSLFAQYPPTAMPWPDERLLFDVDTPEDYRVLTGE